MVERKDAKISVNENMDMLKYLDQEHDCKHTKPMIELNKPLPDEDKHIIFYWSDKNNLGYMIDMKTPK